MNKRLVPTVALMLAATAAHAQAPRPAARPVQGKPAEPAPAPALPAAPAPELSDQARLQAFSITPAYQGLLKHAIETVPPEIFQRCPGLVSTGSQITMLRPLRYAADGVPVAGVWRQTFPVSGCGADTTLNFFFIATPEEKINTVIGLPGSTHADPNLQHEAQTYAITGATNAVQGQSAAPPCPSYAIKNTKFEAYGVKDIAPPDQGPMEPRRPWWETWTVAGCGRSFQVPMNFIPHNAVIEIGQPGHITQADLAAPLTSTPYDKTPDDAPSATPPLATPPPAPAAAKP